MRRVRQSVYCMLAAVAGGSTLGLGAAPPAHAYDSWCHLTEAYTPRVALVSEPLRGNHNQRDIDRLNVYYNKVIPQLSTVAWATFWYPNVWGSPDIREDTKTLLASMDNLQDLANDGTPTPEAVQQVDDAVAVIHNQCEGHTELPPR